MRRKWLFFLTFAVLPGCAQFPDLKHALRALAPVGQAGGNTHTPVQASGQFTFDWTLSGDRSIAPLQVFDNGQSTWLQFAAGSPVPAVFARHLSLTGQPDQGLTDRLLTLRQQGDFVVIDEVPDFLVFRGGHLRAEARRAQSVVLMSSKAEKESAHVPVTQAVLPKRLPEPGRIPAAATAFPVFKPADPGVVAQTPASGLKTQTASVEEPAVSAKPEPLTSFQNTFTVSRVDGNLRQVLARWAVASGWDFGPEHWMVDVDIPIIGAASFDLPFVDAVQALVSSTELADRPLQPCFYSNKVLRVVPYAQACNKAAAPVVAS